MSEEAIKGTVGFYGELAIGVGLLVLAGLAFHYWRKRGKGR